jgi:protein TonB
VEPTPARPAPVFVAARFDADYLHNPKPTYPLLSRRFGEEGRVLLRIRVSPQGSPLAVELDQSSGYPRLDRAARDAVEKWRFLAARQGGEAVASWVLVPIAFKLGN